MTTILKPLAFNDFTGGLVTNRAATELERNQSPDLDNLVLLGTGFKKRLGDAEYNSTAMNSGANVQGLTYFKPTSGTEYLVAVTGNKVFDSNSYDGSMDDRTSGLTITGGQNNIWTFSFLKDLCIGVGGAPNTPFKLTGGANGAVLGGSPNSGIAGFTMRDRMFILGPSANPSTIYWSILANPENWSGTGSGNNAALTNDGDIIVGGISLNNNIALIFKNHSIHILTVIASPFPIKPLIRGIGACGKQAIVKAGGLVYFITNEPRMKATDGYTIFPFPDTLDDTWDGLNNSRLKYIQGIHDPVRNTIHWFCSNGSATANNLDIIWDIQHKCWLRNTMGFDCNVATIGTGNRLFGGHTDGKIYEKYKSSTLNDASETAPGAIDAYWYTPWMDFGSKFSTSQVRYMDIICKTQDTGSLKFSYGFDYNADVSSGEFSVISAGGLWDVDTWDDSFIWGGESFKQKRVFLFGLGNSFQLKIFNNTVGEKMEINSFSLALKSAGVADTAR